MTTQRRVSPPSILSGRGGLRRDHLRLVEQAREQLASLPFYDEPLYYRTRPVPRLARFCCDPVRGMKALLRRAARIQDGLLLAACIAMVFALAYILACEALR